MNGHNFTLSKSISLVSILVLSIISVGFLLPQVIADHGVDPGITKSLTAGSQIINFRDTTNTNPQSSEVSVDTSTTRAGFFTIIVEEEDANLDATAIDVILSSATSTTSGSDEATTTMPETGPDTGVFSGTINVSLNPTSGNNLQVGPVDEITVLYDSESQGVGRLKADVNVVTPGNVKITDELLDLDEFTLNHNFRPVTHPVKIQLEGATFDTTSALAPVITIAPLS